MTSTEPEVEWPEPAPDPPEEPTHKSDPDPPEDE